MLFDGSGFVDDVLGVVDHRPINKGSDEVKPLALIPDGRPLTVGAHEAPPTHQQASLGLYGEPLVKMCIREADVGKREVIAGF